HRLPPFCRRLLQRIPERRFQRDRRAVAGDGERALERLHPASSSLSRFIPNAVNWDDEPGRRESNLMGFALPAILWRFLLTLHRIEPPLMKPAFGTYAFALMPRPAECSPVGGGLPCLRRTGLLLP